MSPSLKKLADHAGGYLGDGTVSGHDKAKARFILTLLRKVSVCVQRGIVRNMRYRQDETRKALRRDPNVLFFGDEFEFVHLE